MTGEPWPGVIPGAKPEIDRLVEFKVAKSGAALDEDIARRPRRPVSMSGFSLKRVSREAWHRITNDALNR